jgi:hypothetical protein
MLFVSAGVSRLPVLTWRMAFYHLAYNIDDNVGMLPSCTHTDGMVADLVLTPTSCADCWALRIVPLGLVPSPYVTVCWCELIGGRPAAGAVVQLAPLLVVPLSGTGCRSSAKLVITCTSTLLSTAAHNNVGLLVCSIYLP